MEQCNHVPDPKTAWIKLISTVMRENKPVYESGAWFNWINMVAGFRGQLLAIGGTEFDDEQFQRDCYGEGES